MQIENLQVDSVNDFFQSIESGTPLPEQQKQPDNITNLQEPLTAPVLEGGQNPQDFLDGIKKEEEVVEEEKTKDDFNSYVSFFQEQQILGKYEDGSLPQTKEELVNAVKQSSLLIAQQQAQQFIQDEIASLPASIQQIIDYGKGGVTTATELKQFINSVSNYEQINQLDPTNEQHQEAIIRMQLINSGLDEATANEQIDIYKETNKLAQVAEKLVVPLKETYRKEYQQQMLDKQEKENFLSSQIESNSVNIQYYLDQDTSYLPFKLDDNKTKAGVYELGAKVMEWDDKGNPIFGWQKKLESLQYSSNPDEYKEFVKILTFINNSSFYEKKLGKVASNAATEKEYKQVKQITPRAVTTNVFEQTKATPQIQKGQLTW